MAVTVRVPHQTPMFDEHGHMTRTWILFFERLGKGSERDIEKATFGIGIGTPQSAGTDLTPHYIVRRGGEFMDVVAKAKTAPAGGYLDIDIQISKKQADGTHAAFVSIFASRLNIPDGSAGQHSQDAFAAGIRADIDDWLRIDLVTGSVENAQDIEVVARWLADDVS